MKRNILRCCLENGTRGLLVFMVIVTLIGLNNCTGIMVKPGLEMSNTGDHQGALAFYETLIADGKANGQVYRLAYEAAFRSGKRVTASSYYQKSLEAGFPPDSLNNLARDLWYDRTVMLMSTDNWKEAAKSADMLAQIAPESRQDKFCHAMLAGKRKVDKGAHKGLWDALSDFTQAASYDPASGLPYFMIGRARYKNNRTDYDSALEDYYKALEIEPDGLFIPLAKQEIKKIEDVKKKMKAFWGK